MTTSPTIGRKVWYWPVSEQNQLTQYNENIALDATVVYPWSDNCVNLRVTDHAGIGVVRTSVHLHQGDVESRPKDRSCATWMPYQRAQAEKAATGT